MRHQLKPYPYVSPCALSTQHKLGDIPRGGTTQRGPPTRFRLATAHAGSSGFFGRLLFVPMIVQQRYHVAVGAE